MKKKLKNRTRMESVSFEGHGRLNREKGIVRDCKILGMESRHGYTYTAGAMKGAVQLYEGARVNIDHPNRKTPGVARSYRDRFGAFENVRFVEGDGLRGDFHFNPKHQVADQFCWDVENDPAACGFSHNASGPLVNRGGKLLCESIEAVRSVDLVADAATTASLFEGKPRMAMKIKARKGKMDRKTVRRKLIEGMGKKYARLLIENLDPAGQQAAAAAAPAEPSKSGNVDALLALVRQVLEDPNITAEESIKAVSKRLKALKEMIPGGSAKDAAGAAGGDAGGTLAEGEGDEEDPDEDADEEATADDDADEDDDEDLVEGDDEDPPARPRKPKKNGRRLDAETEARIARLEAREERVAVRELCEGAGFKPTEKQMKLLLSCEDEDTRNDLLESWTDLEDSPTRIRKTIKGKAKARELVEGGTGGGGKGYKTSKDWAAGLV